MVRLTFTELNYFEIVELLMIELLFSGVNFQTTLAGGLLIGLSATLLLLFNGRLAGISGIAYSLFDKSKTDKLWQLLFLAGLISGAKLLHVFADMPEPSSSTASMPILIIGGLLVGFGTQMGSGCTSGHGICGISRYSGRSITSTLLFMIFGIISVSVFRHLLGLL